MSQEECLNVQTFEFRGLHPCVFMGTASDRYAGWIGQIYSKDRYAHRTSHRQKVVGGTSFTEEVLPVESVGEYFTHFRVLELDFTFYRPLLDEAGKPTQNYHTLRTYSQYVGKNDRLILKVPQAVCAQKLRRGGKFIENSTYLNPKLFTHQFYTPAVELLGSTISGFVFEQEYQRSQDRVPLEKLTVQLDEFFQAIPKDDRYHLELRTESLLAQPLFAVMEKNGIGQVLSHWTWLPSLGRQFSKSQERFLNAGRQCVLRLLTPRGMRYEDAYAKAHPFDRLVEGMLDLRMIEETADLMWKAVDQKAHINVIVNNRAGGNAPIISQHIAERFLNAGRKVPSSTP